MKFALLITLFAASAAHSSAAVDCSQVAALLDSAATKMLSANSKVSCKGLDEFITGATTRANRVCDSEIAFPEERYLETLAVDQAQKCFGKTIDFNHALAIEFHR